MFYVSNVRVCKNDEIMLGVI